MNFFQQTTNNRQWTMDHLMTKQERIDLWYSQQRVPECLRVMPAENVAELKEGVSKTNEQGINFIWSIPYHWIETKHFSGTDLQNKLQDDGFMVISGVLTKEECNHAISLAWEWLASATVAEYAL